MKLTAKQQRFIDEYLVDLNATQAAIRAGYSEKTAYSIGEENLKKPDIAAEINKRRAELSEKTQLNQEWVLVRYREMIEANPNDLVEMRRVPCRYCWGKNHAYQWRTEREFQAACDEAQTKEKPLPTDEGGYGYTRNREPNLDCPECDGLGMEKLLFKATGALSKGALALYGGIKVSKGDVEVKLHDKMAALNQVARHLGFFNDKMNVNVEVSEDILTHLAEIAEQSRAQSLVLAQKIEKRKK